MQLVNLHYNVQYEKLTLILRFAKDYSLTVFIKLF